MVNRIIHTLACFVIFLLIKPVHSQTVWTETFDVPDKGYWADSTGAVHSDISDIAWSVNVDNCNFIDENDYAKTVSTSGGRFEVLDTQGEAIWTSETIDIAPYDAVNLSLEATETGSGAANDKKYVKAYYILDHSEPVPFEPEFEASGDWGSSSLEQKSISGSSLQILIRMNSSYANDKVYIDNIVVDAIDNSHLQPSHIQIMQAPVYAFENDTITIIASVFNKNNQQLNTPNMGLHFEGNFIEVEHHYQNGFYLWKLAINESGKQHFSVYSTHIQLTRADSTLMVFSASEIIAQHDFEDQSGNEWNTNDQWEISSSAPISGEYSIQHIVQTEGGLSELHFPETPLSLSEKDYLISFDLKNGNWDPSSANAFYIMLYNEENNTIGNGYAVGVNATGSTDLVSLWKVKNGEPDEILTQTAFDWDASQTVRVSILRWAGGLWQINATDMHSGESKTAEFTDREFLQIEKIALFFRYSVTRSGQLWFDNYLVAGSNTPPFIEMAKPIAANRFQVNFNKPVNTAGISPSNFSLFDSENNEFEILSVDILNPKELIIEAPHSKDTLLRVVAENIAELDDGQSETSSFTFENVLTAEIHDVIFTEIMADINPVPAQLPAQRYVEIHNRSDKNIQLRNWVYYVRDRGWTIPSKIIRPGEYLVMCGNNFADEFEDKSKLLVFPRFPDILVGGVNQRISSPHNLIIDEVHHDLSWYADSDKQRGGYSLERIDLDRLCNHYGNWIATNDPRGGTPGEINSVNGHNPDNEIPVIIGVSALSLKKIEVFFNKPMDTLSSVSLSNYSIEGISIHSANYQKETFSVLLNLKTPIKSRTDYRLTVRRLSDECSNVLNIASVPFAFQEIYANDIVINEVLFNSYTGGANFVELYNRSGFTIDLSQLKFASRSNKHELRAIYDISPVPAPFENGQYLAFSPNIEAVAEFYHIPYPENMFEVERLPAYYNTSGNVVLLNQSNQVIDEFAYHHEMHSEWFSDVKGVSLERLSTNKPTNEHANWKSATSWVGYATPGYENSQTETDKDAEVYIDFVSDVVSPNGDGYHDELIITFNLNSYDYLINLYVYNAHGIEMKRLTNNELIGHMNQLEYDCTDNSGKLLSMGTYILFAELLQLNGKKQVIRKLFHVSDVR